MTKRFAYARIMQETNALSPVTTGLADFELSHYLVGDALATDLTEVFVVSVLEREQDG